MVACAGGLGQAWCRWMVSCSAGLRSVLVRLGAAWLTAPACAVCALRGLSAVVLAEQVAGAGRGCG